MAVPPSPLSCGTGMGDRTEGWGWNLAATSCAGESQPAGSLVKWACGEQRGAAGRMGPAGTGMALSDPCHRPGGARGHPCPTLWILTLAAMSSQRNGAGRCTPEGLQEASGQQGRGRMDTWHGLDDGHSTAQSLALKDTHVSQEDALQQGMLRRVLGGPSPRRLSRAPPGSYKYTQNWGSTQAPAFSDSWCCPSPGSGVPSASWGWRHQGR